MRALEVERNHQDGLGAGLILGLTLGEDPGESGTGLGGGVVMEGRDIGTVVSPEAPLKVFLTASADERASTGLLEGLQIDLGEAARAAVRSGNRNASLTGRSRSH